jgi:DNA-directed RNA polymerase specialized sigma24 family protein
MQRGRESIRPLAFLPNSVDCLGRDIEPRVFTIAKEIAPQAVSYGIKLLGDAAVALTLFEEAAASVSQALQNKTSSEPHIREMRGYLFRAYLRRISDVRKTTPCHTCAMRPYLQQHSRDAESHRADGRVLLREFLDGCDRVTQQIVQRRLEGCSWREIEERYGVSANAARLRLSKAIRHFQRDSSSTRGPATLSQREFANKSGEL